MYVYENYAIIGSDNGLSPDRHKAIIWTNAGLIWTGHLKTSFSEKVPYATNFICKNEFKNAVSTSIC